jgi:hypothetical protein
MRYLRVNSQLRLSLLLLYFSQLLFQAVYTTLIIGLTSMHSSVGFKLFIYVYVEKSF